jgi:hypothetical protein
MANENAGGGKAKKKVIAIPSRPHPAAARAHASITRVAGSAIIVECLRVARAAHRPRDGEGERAAGRRAVCVLGREVLCTGQLLVGVRSEAWAALAVTLPFDAHGRPMCAQAAQAGGGLVASESSPRAACGAAGAGLAPESWLVSGCLGVPGSGSWARLVLGLRHPECGQLCSVLSTTGGSQSSA